MMFFICCVLIAFVSTNGLKSSMEMRAMMEMEANHFLDRVNRLTYDIAENVHPAHLDREEDLNDYLSKVQSSMVNDVPHLDASFSVIDLMGHSMRHRVFDKIHSFVELAETLKGSGCQTTPTIGNGKSNPREAVRELQDILKAKGESPGVSDGLWGKNTRNAVKSYQGKHHLTQDGIVGPITWGKLCGTSGSSGSAQSSQSSGSTSQQNHAPTVSDKPSEGGRAVIDAARGLRDYLISVTSGYGTTFNGYGSGANQYVCTTFVSKVLRNVGFPFAKGDDVDRNINIRGLDLGADPPTKLGELVRAGNEKTKGVVHALTIKKWGTEVTDLDTVQPGDCCQYWYGPKSNKGHVVIVDTVINKGHRVKVIGSHGSKKGVDWLNVNFHTMKKTYCVRPHEVDTSGAVRTEVESEEDDISDIAGLPTVDEEIAEELTEHAKACTACKSKVTSKDGDPNESCANECAVAPANVNSESFLENMVKTFFDGITTVHSGNTCKKFEMNWECMNAYFPHMVIVGASGNVGPMVGGAEVVTDYNAGEVGVFLYGGLTVGTGMMGVSGGFYAGVGYKGVQSEHCCKNDQDFGTQTCEPDASRTPCPLRDSYKGYFLGGDVSVAIPPFGAGVMVAMSAGAVFEESNLDDIAVFNSSLLSESGDIRDTSVSHVGNQAVDLAKEVHERDPRKKSSVQEGAMQALKNAGCFVTKPLPHLTKTIAFSFDAQAKEVAVGVNLATTHYKHVGSMKCWDQDGGGPLCFAAALAISPPWDIPPNPVGTTIKVIGFSMFMEKWCEKNAVNKESTTCKLWFKLKDFVTEKMKQIAEMIKWLTSEMAKKLEELKIVWDNAMQVLDEFKQEFDKMIAEAKEAADKWVAENIGENLDEWRAHFGDVSPEEKENVIYLPSEYVDRVGTYVKFIDCHFDGNTGYGPDDYDLDSDLETFTLKAPYWTCKSCDPRDHSDCSSSKNTEVGFAQGGDGIGDYAWRPDEATIMERGFGMFFENSSSNDKRSFVKCHLNNRVRLGESVMSLITLGDDDDLSATEIWIARGSVEETREAEIHKLDDDGNILGGPIGHCNVMYNHKKSSSDSRFKGSSKLLRHNKN